MDKKAFLGKRRDRAIATLLSFKERECDHYLPPETAHKLRKEILDQINELCDTAFDLISDSDVIWNEEFMDRFDELAEQIANLSRS
jgi:hypothetical protein